MADYFQLLGGIVVVLLALYYYFTSTFDFWKSRGVPGPQPIPGLGTTKDVLLKRMHTSIYLQKLYNEYKNEPLIGIFMNRHPVLIICDLDFIKDVLIKDFSSFDDRGNAVHETKPMTQNIFNLEPKRWRPLRSKLSPVFTSGKLKEMFPLILECSKQLEKYLAKVAETDVVMDVRKIAARYTINVIGSCIFGINISTLSNEESEFRRIAEEAIETFNARLVPQVVGDSPGIIIDLFGYMLPESDVIKYFTRIIPETIKYREENNVVRPDFVHMLTELKKHPDKLQNIELTDAILNAQALLFFVAGFETSSTTMAHALYEMALNLDMQEKLREEIQNCFVKTNGQFKYEDVKGMKYLDKVFKETLRKYPPAVALKRKSTRNYTFNGTKISIPKNTMIVVPVYAIHHDPSYYPNPETFDPERFDEDVVAARHPMTFLPFGDGPRNCIGERFAVYQSKMGLIKMLKDFRVDVCDKTVIPYDNDPRAFVLSPKGGMYLKISKVKH